MQFISKNPLLATFQLPSAASLNSGQPQNVLLGNGLSPLFPYDGSCIGKSSIVKNTLFFTKLTISTESIMLLTIYFSVFRGSEEVVQYEFQQHFLPRLIEMPKCSVKSVTLKEIDIIH